jgi:hypothetical protein
MVGRLEDGLVATKGGDGAEDTDGGGRRSRGRGKGVEVGGQDARRREGHGEWPLGWQRDVDARDEVGLAQGIRHGR